MDAKRELEKVIANTFFKDNPVISEKQVKDGVYGEVADAILSKLPELVEIDKEKLVKAIKSWRGNSKDRRSIFDAICRAKGILKAKK